MKKVIVGFFVLLGLSVLVFAFSGCKSGGYYGKSGGYYGKNNVFKLVRKLDLSDEQEDKMHDLKKDYFSDKKSRKEFKKRFRKGFNQNDDIAKFFSEDKFDKEAFKTNAKEKSAQRKKDFDKIIEKKIEKRADNMEKIFNILNAEQRAKLVELSKK